MGYSFATLDWLDGLGLAPGSRVLDIGSQDLYLSDPVEPPYVNRFLERHGARPIGNPALPCIIPMHDIWSRVGFEYQCVDIDDRPGTVRVDLQSPHFPRQLKSRFDLVMNAGTTEHLSNPLCGFSFMHFACRDGGILASDVPFSGYGNHALINPTAKFWHVMAQMNRYEALTAQVRQSIETPGDGTYFNDDFKYIEGIGGATDLSWMIRIAFRKHGATAFVPPMDYAGTLARPSTLALIKASIARFQKAWTTQELTSALDNVSRHIWGTPPAVLARDSLGPLGRLRRSLGL